MLDPLSSVSDEENGEGKGFIRKSKQKINFRILKMEYKIKRLGLDSTLFIRTYLGLKIQEKQIPSSKFFPSGFAKNSLFDSLNLENDSHFVVVNRFI